MFIKPITGGMFESTAYLLGDAGRAVLIDAGVNSQAVVMAAEQMNAKIEKIILTHGHIDHIVEIDEIVNKTNAKVYIHVDDEMAMTDARSNLSAFVGEPVSFVAKYEVLREGDVLMLGDLQLKIHHTPGHTPGSICIEADGNLFTGDTLFHFGYGRVDLPNGSYEDIHSSIVNKLFGMPEELVVYPGHGAKTTIKDEKASNPIKHAFNW